MDIYTSFWRCLYTSAAVIFFYGGFPLYHSMKQRYNQMSLCLPEPVIVPIYIIVLFVYNGVFCSDSQATRSSTPHSECPQQQTAGYRPGDMTQSWVQAASGQNFKTYVDLACTAWGGGGVSIICSLVSESQIRHLIHNYPEVRDKSENIILNRSNRNMFAQ